MKRYVIPDFLAAVTAMPAGGAPNPARGRARRALRESAGDLPPAMVMRVARRATEGPSVPVQLSFDDQWGDSWYARARLAAALRRPVSAGWFVAGNHGSSAVSAIPADKDS
jgi:hypothetical protein